MILITKIRRRRRIIITIIAIIMIAMITIIIIIITIAIIMSCVFLPTQNKTTTLARIRNEPCVRTTIIYTPPPINVYSV